jgi:argininosuccinate lyase
MKLWNAHWSTSMDELTARLNDSLPFDQRLAIQDVRGSIAWASALQKAGILQEDELARIVAGLSQILDELEEGRFTFQPSDEDIHTAVERRLGEVIGALAGKLHTGRSRNDQVATDFRLWMMETCDQLESALCGLQKALLARAETDWGVILPGYTHFQQAQPVLLSHWWLAHFWALERDRQRLKAVREHSAMLPLGSGALAGTGFATIDRFTLAEQLGFSAPVPNSIDAVCDRDFAAEFLFWAALLGVHLSRLAEALILYTTREFGFITLDDAYTTGSSLMPQKKNPDPLELIRAKSGVLIGKLTTLLTILKGLPSAYDKDLQEDKPPVFEAADTLAVVLPVLSGLLNTLKINSERIHQSLDWSMLATDVADYLVEKGIPFRQAHSVAARVVQRAASLGLSLRELPLDEWRAVHPAFEQDVLSLLDLSHCLDRRAAFGGTAPGAVRKQLELARTVLAD